MKPISSRELIGWSAVRVSTERQGSVRYGSLESQNATVARLIKDVEDTSDNKYKIVKELSEERSGRKEKQHLRLQFLELLDAIRRKKIDFVAIEKIDRLSRWGFQIIEFLELCHEQKIEVLIDGYGIYNHDNETHRMRAYLEACSAESESNRTKHRVTTKKRLAMVLHGKDSSTVPELGLDAHPDKNCFYEWNEDELKQVLKILNYFVEVKSLKATVKFCNKKGFKTKERLTKESSDNDGNRIKSRQIGGDSFTAPKLRRMLTSTRLRGWSRFKDTLDQFPDRQDSEGFVRWEYAHGKRIPDELWEKVDQVLKGFSHSRPRSSKHGIDYPLSGYLVDHNGNPFTGQSAKRGGYAYYKTNPKDGTEGRRVSSEAIESIVMSKLKEYLLDNSVLKNLLLKFEKHQGLGVSGIQEDIAITKRQITKLSSQLQGLDKQIRDMATRHDGDRFMEMLEWVKDQRDSVKQEMEGAESKLNSLELAKDEVSKRLNVDGIQNKIKMILDQFDKSRGPEKKALIRSIIPKVEITEKNEVKIWINPLPSGEFPVLASECHGGGKIVALCSKWRGGRDSNPRPPA